MLEASSTFGKYLSIRNEFARSYDKKQVNVVEQSPQLLMTNEF